MDIDELCNIFEKTPMHHDREQAFRELSISQGLKLCDISSEFLHSSIWRYRTYLLYIDFALYRDAGERIVVLIYDFINTPPDELNLSRTKCQIIDRLILELFDAEVRNFEK